MAEFPALPLWTDAYLGDAGHLTDAETGRYIKLLMQMWRAPRCRLPDDDMWLSRRFQRTEDQVRTELRPLIVEFCICSRGWITQKRLIREWEWCRKKAQKNSTAAKSRWIKEKGASERICERNAPTPTPTPTPTPLLENLSSPPSLSSSGAKENYTNGTRNGTGHFPSGTTTIKDQDERVRRFQVKIAPVVAGGWDTIFAATDDTNPKFRTAYAACDAAASRIGKQMPRNWPTNLRH